MPFKFYSQFYSGRRTRPVVIIEHPLDQIKVIRFVVWQLWLAVLTYALGYTSGVLRNLAIMPLQS